MTSRQIIVLVGPSGSGKTSIGKILSESGIPRLITTTTREPRDGEKDGVDYYFREFTELDSDDFVEQTIYNGNRYGLTKKEVTTMLEKYDRVHVSLDQNGAEAVSEAFPEEACVVFISITEEEMIRRMKIRGDSPEEIKDRINFSRKTNELKPPEITDLVVINDNINDAAKDIIENVVEK
jgi:guanylate kinase